MRLGEAEREKLIAEQEESGLTASAWCKERGIHYSTFLGWKKKSERTEVKWIEAGSDKTSGKQEPKLQPIKIRACGVEIEIPYSKEAIGDLLKVLTVW